MSRTFSHETRILACSGCGAALEASVQGGTFPCNYCGATNQVAARIERPAFAVDPAAPVDERERIRRLRVQDGKPFQPPASLEGLLAADGTVPAWKVQEAVSIWQSARREVGETSSFEAAERLLFLTMVLANHFAEGQDLVRQRAMFESALEVFFLPRHQQTMRGYLARCAARAGELDAAEQWLAPCDPRSDDLQSDSAYRFSRAFIDTARGDFDAVLRVLGHGNEDVPLMQEMDATAAMFRANAWEKKGDMDRAVGLLRGAMAEGVGSRRAMERTVGRYADWQLCGGSFPRASGLQRKASVQEARNSPTALVAWILIAVGGLLALIMVGLLIGAVVCLVLALISILAPLAAGGGEGAWAAGGTGAFAFGTTAFSLAIPAVSMLPFAGILLWIGKRLLTNAKRTAELRERGVDAYGEVLDISTTGMSVNDVPQYRIKLRVTLGGKDPVEASVDKLMGPVDAARFQPGTVVPVLVDPEDPTRVDLDT